MPRFLIWRMSAVWNIVILLKSTMSALILRSLFFFCSCLAATAGQVASQPSPSPPLLRNIARLDRDFPGAARARVWSRNRRASDAPALADGDLAGVAAVLTAGGAAGV